MGKNTENVKTGMARNMPDSSKLQPKSQALIYHVHLKEVFESHPESPSVSRTKICFEIFDQIVDQTGSFSTVLSIIKEELRKSCYSDTVTAIASEPYYENVPYYMLDKKESTTRKLEEINGVIQELELRLKLRDEDNNLAFRQTTLLKQQVEELERLNAALKEENLQARILVETANCEKTLVLQKLSAIQLKYEKESNEFKQLQEKTRAAFEQLSASKFENSKKVEPEKDLLRPESVEVPRNASAMLKYDVNQASFLEVQFSGLLDRLLDNFETNLNHLQAKKEMGINTDIIAEELRNASDLYRKQIGSYRAEMIKLQEHKASLLLQEKKNESNLKLPSVFPIDVTMRKSAIIMHSSQDGGKIFQMHPGNRYCTRCGEKVYICPHLKLDNSPLTFQSKTVIKFSRPMLRLKAITNDENGCIDVENGLTEDEDENVSSPFFKIWKDFYDRRGGFKPKKDRKIPLYKLLSFIDELYTQKDQWDREDGHPLASLQDSFYRLMHERYAFEDVVVKVCHDWISSFQEHESTNENIRIFALQLAGIYQEQWRYMQSVKNLFSDLIGKTLETEVLQARIKVLYPNRESTVLKRIEYDYMQFCRKKISTQSFIDYVFLQLAEETDLNLYLMKCIVERYDTQQTGMLSKYDFLQIIIKCIPLANKAEVEALYALAEEEFGIDQVVNERLFMIGAFVIVSTAQQQGWVDDKLIVVTRYAQDCLD